MTLNIKERNLTSEELKKNLKISEATHEEIQISLGMSQEEFEETLTHGANSDPRAVYRFADLCKQAAVKGLKPDEIKKGIKNWKAGQNRI